MTKTLVAGWFSFEQMGASAGDLLARDLACEWLRESGQPFEVALAPPFEGGVRWETLAPGEYGRVVFVCGPFGNGEPIQSFLAHFASSELIGLNLTLLERLDVWNPFALLLERDSSRRARPDMALAAHRPTVPVVGVILIDSQPEYGTRDLHDAVNAAVERVVAGREVARVRIDTRLDIANGLRTSSEIESLIAKMDCVVTTRLHGMVLALKHGVPAVAIDSVAGGAKVLRQARALAWPLILRGDSVDDRAIDDAIATALTPELRLAARTCRERAIQELESVRREFVTWLRQHSTDRG